jgi:glycosyltransferase involved in cell wall biosynthesis
MVDCDDYEAESNRYSGLWQKRIVALFEKNVPRKGHLITTNTYFMRDKLIGWRVPQERIHYLPNGIDRERFSPPPEQQVQDLKLQLGIDEKRIIIYVGTLSLPSHPVDILIRAFAEVHQAMRDTVLLLVGGGEDIAFLKDYAKDLGLNNVVIFTGRIAPDQVPTYYRLADVSVDPVHDNDAARGRCPLKLFESWSCQVPFVSADVGDRRNLLGNPPAGLLAKPGDANDLAISILSILNNEPFASELCQLGSKRVLPFYWDVLVNDLEPVFQNILQK